MCGVRKNTLVVDFSVLPVRPEPGKVQQFLEDEINLQYADVKNIQLHNSRNCVYIEMKSDEIVSRYQSAHNWKRKMLCANKAFRIPVYGDCEAINVRVHDLPPSMNDATIGNFMMKFGEVISIRRESWKHYFSGLPNGVRVVRMNLFRDIPSYITIDDEITLVSYLNQPKICRHCEKPLHPGNKCPQTSTQSNNNTPSTSSNRHPSPSEEVLSQDEFPPINNNLQKPSTETSVPRTEEQKHQNSDDDGTDNEDNASSTASSDFNEVTHKRRRAAKQTENETKKVRSDEQCSPNGSTTGHEEIVEDSSKLKNKNVKGFNITRNKKY